MYRFSNLFTRWAKRSRSPQPIARQKATLTVTLLEDRVVPTADASIIGSAGDEFRVNLFAPNDQIYPAVTALPDGGYFAAWWERESFFGFDARYNIYGARLDAEGNNVFGEILINSANTNIPANLSNRAAYLSVTGLEGGGFVVTWNVVTHQSSIYSLGEVYGRLFTPLGMPIGGDFLINTWNLLTSESRPSVTALADGGFVATWQSVGQKRSVHGKRYDAEANDISGEFLINTPDLGSANKYPSVATLADGGFVVTWISFGFSLDGTGSTRGLYAKQYNAFGEAVSGDLLVSNSVRDDQAPSVTDLADGGFVVAWESRSSNDRNYDVYARRYNIDGSALGGEFQVNTDTAGNHHDPAAAGLANGGFVVTWSTWIEGQGSVVLGQKYNADGATDGTAFQINMSPESGAHYPSVASLNDGSFVVAWQGYQDGWDIFARRFITDPFKVNGKLGDVIKVDVPKLLEAIGVSLAGLDPTGYGLKAMSNDRGRVAEHVGDLAKGMFYFLPATIGIPLDYGATRADPGIGESTLVVTNGTREFTITFSITDGASIAGENAVRLSWNDNIALYQQSQRLRYLGFPGSNGQPLAVSIDNFMDLLWAKQLFSIALDPATVRGNLGFGFDSTGGPNAGTKYFKDYINTTHAVNWELLTTIPKLSILSESRRYGTDASGAFVETAISSLAGTQISTGFSRLDGSGSPSKTHDGSRSVDLDVDGKGDFLNYTVIISPQNYLYLVLSSPGGKIVVRDGATYRAGDPSMPADVANAVRKSDLYPVFGKNTTRTQKAAKMAEVKALLVGIKDLIDYKRPEAEVQAVLDGFTNAGTPRIYYNDPRFFSDDGVVRFEWGHYNHVHVAIPSRIAGGTATPVQAPQPKLGPLFAPLTLSNDRLNNAIDLGQLDGAQTVSGLLDDATTEQIYRFILGEFDDDHPEQLTYDTPRDLSVLLDGLPDDVEFELILDPNGDGHGQVLFSSAAGVIDAAEMPSGEYFLRVFRTDGDAAFDLTLTVAPLPVPPDGAGDTLATAADLGTLTGTVIRNDFLGEVDRTDYYRFQFTVMSDLSVLVDDLDLGDLSVVIGQDANGNGILDPGEILDLSDEDGNEAEALQLVRLPAGEYLLVVARLSGNTDYQLTLTATASVLPADSAGDTLATAMDMGVLTGTRTLTDFVGGIDPVDLYRFTIPAADSLTITLSGLSADADIEFYRDTNGNGILDADEILGESRRSGSDDDQISLTSLLAGEYFIRVLQYEGETDYSLNLEVTSREDRPAVHVLDYAFPNDANTWVVRVSFNKPVTGFELSDVLVTSGTATELAPDGDGYLVTIVPTGSENVSVRILGGAVQDATQQSSNPTNPVFWQPGKTWSDFLVNSYTIDTQHEPQVAALADGGFVVVWESTWGQDGSGYGVFSQRYDSSGKPIGEEYRVNTQVEGSQKAPAVAALADGGYVVVWSGYGLDNTDSINAQRYDANGMPVGGEFRINATSAISIYSSNFRIGGPTITGLPDGGFLVAWFMTDERTVINGEGVNRLYTRSYDITGEPNTGDLPVSLDEGNAVGSPAIAVLADGGYVIVWSDAGPDSDDWQNEIYGQRFDDNDNPVGDRFLVYTDTETRYGDIHSDVTALADGGYVIIWYTYTGENHFSYFQHFQRFDADGSPIGEETIVTYDINGYGSEVTALPDGGFLISWSGQPYMYSTNYEEGYGVYTQRYGPDATPFGEPLLVNSWEPASWSVYLGSTDIAAMSDGRVVVVWVSNKQDGSGDGIIGRVIGEVVSPPPDINGPDVTISRTTTGPVSSNFLVAVAFSEFVNGFSLDGIEVVNGTASDLVGTGAGYAFTITPVSDGLVEVRVLANAARNASGTGNTPSETLQTEVDSTRPGTTIAISNYDDARGRFTVTVEFTEPVSGLTAGGIEVINGAVSGLTGQNTHYTFYLVPETLGLMTARVRSGAAESSDGRLNSASNQIGFVIDEIRPTSTLSTATVNSVTGNFEVTATFSEPLPYFVPEAIAVANGTVSSIVDLGTHYTFIVTAESTGQVNVKLLAGAGFTAFGTESLESNLLSLEAQFPDEDPGPVPPTPSVPPTPAPTTYPVNQTELDRFIVTGGATSTIFLSDRSTVQIPTQTYIAGQPSGVSVVADVNGDGTPDIIVGTGPGTRGQIVVIDGITGAVLNSFLVFEESFKGGILLAGGDVNGDGKADIAVSADYTGGARVIIYSGADGSVLANFFGIDDLDFRGGARVALGDINGDGFADLAVAAGTGGGPRLALYDGLTLRADSVPTRLASDFFVFEETLRNGVNLTLGDINGDNLADLIVGGGPTSGPRVLALNAVDLLSTTSQVRHPLLNFLAANEGLRQGVRLVAKHLDGDRFADLVVAVSGLTSLDGTNQITRVVSYLGKDMTLTGEPPSIALYEVLESHLGGVFVG